MSWTRYFRRKFWDAERARELDSYLELETEDNIARGAPPESARLAARRKLGNATLVREEIYGMNTLGFLETLWQDLRYGWRVLSKSPGLTAVALISLSLGIGATTAIFSVVYGVLISPYPYARPGEIWAPLVQNAKDPNQGRATCKASEFLRLRQVSAFASAMATLPGQRLLSGGRAPENFTSIMVTANAFQFLGVDPVLGRTIFPSDINAGGQAQPVVVLSYKAWQRLFNGRADALGKTVVLDDVAQTVIGVMPPRFGWWTNDGGWLPLPIDPRDKREMFPIVRLTPGVSSRAAQEQLRALHRELAQANPSDFPREGFISPLRNYLDMTVASGEMRSSLSLLFGAVGLLLLIACANVANLQLARASSRAREIALRISVGAGRARVLRQLLTENVTLSLAGGALGILLAIAITRTMVVLMPDYYVPNEARITLNGYVLAFSAAVSVLTGILFGLAPAMECSRLNVVETLKEATKGSGAGSAGGRTRNVLVVAEVALSVVLLVGAGLTIRGFVNLERTETGFQPERILMVDLQLPAKRYTTWAQRVGFTQELLQRVAAIPGAQSASIGNGGLPFGGPRSQFSLEGHLQGESKEILVGLVSADYSRTLGIPLLRGRGLTEQDVSHADPVGLINEAAARLWPAGDSPIGRRIHLNILEKLPPELLAPPGGASAEIAVVGILANTRNNGLRNAPDPAVFIPYTMVAPAWRTLAVRAHGDPNQLLNPVRERVRQLDPELPIHRPVTMEEEVASQAEQPRFNMALFGFFGALGLTLAAIGIFSVLSYSVASRTHEIGVRMALGAESGHVLSLMLATGAKLVVAGVVAGLAGSFLLAHYLQSKVFEVPVSDPLSLAGAIAVLAIVAFFACLLPARRAARVDPMVALRHD
jgi:putative ABC transport system permease protein